MNNKIKFVFFGSSRFSVIVLDELELAGYIPDCVVTTPDKPKGRKLILTPSPVKDWAQKRKIPVFDPMKLDQAFVEKLEAIVNKNGAELFVVASYGKIIPESIINTPLRKTLNIHPSLLPKYRGASPLQSTIIDDAKRTGVTIIRIDEKMDHGPIVAQEGVNVNEWPIYEEFEEMMAKIGGRLLVKIMPFWIAGKIKEKKQNHNRATYTKKIKKENGLIDLNGNPYLNFRKIQAFHEWPQAYFIQEHNSEKIRVKITQASFGGGKLNIKKVVPEGRREISYDDFSRGYGNVSSVNAE